MYREEVTEYEERLILDNSREFTDLRVDLKTGQRYYENLANKFLK